jgi:transcriptional regulator with XRE-family HTH domain
MLSEDSYRSYSTVTSVEELGSCIRLKRKSLGMTLQTVSGLTGIGYRYLSELERGKESAEIGKALRVMRYLGLQIAVRGNSNKDISHA